MDGDRRKAWGILVSRSKKGPVSINALEGDRMEDRGNPVQRVGRGYFRHRRKTLGENSPSGLIGGDGEDSVSRDGGALHKKGRRAERIGEGESFSGGRGRPGGGGGQEHLWAGNVYFCRGEDVRKAKSLSYTQERLKGGREKVLQGKHVQLAGRIQGTASTQEGVSPTEASMPSIQKDPFS